MRITRKQKHKHNPPFSRKKELVEYETRAFDGDIKTANPKRLKLYIKGRPIIDNNFGTSLIVGWTHKRVKKKMLVKV